MTEHQLYTQMDQYYQDRLKNVSANAFVVCIGILVAGIIMAIALTNI